MKLTVIGLGQTLRGDDAAGREAVRRWQKAYPATAARADVDVQLSELPGLALIDMLEGYDGAILVDALQSSAQPGTLHVLALEDLASFDLGAKSAHGWGVAETLKMGAQLDPATPRIPMQLIGIVIKQMGLGSGLSEAVENALPAACRSIQETVERLLSSMSTA